MKLVLKEEAIIHKNSDNCTAIEYETNDKDINIACVEIRGRFPEKGLMTNTQCKELLYIVEGKGQLFINNKVVSLKKDDVILIEPNEKYYWEGNLKVIPACYPAWSIEQVKFFAE